MAKRNRKHGKSGRSTALGILRAALVSCGAAVAVVAMLTLLVYLDVLHEDAVSAIGAALKILGAVLAAVLAIKYAPHCRSWLCGGIAGALFSVLSTAAMCLLAGELVLSLGVAGDVMMSFACGAATAALLRVFRKAEA